jgi:hypothetical protein
MAFSLEKNQNLGKSNLKKSVFSKTKSAYEE